MKYLAVFALFVISQAVPLLPTLLSTGTSLQTRTQDALGNYNFGYTEGHATGGTFRKESGDIAGNKIGSYGLSDADGRQRVVNYVADGAGFRAAIATNEPGVDPSKDPAAVAINKGAVIGAPLALAGAPLGLAASTLALAPSVAVASNPLLSSYSVSVPHLGAAYGLIL